MSGGVRSTLRSNNKIKLTDCNRNLQADYTEPTSIDQRPPTPAIPVKKIKKTVTFTDAVCVAVDTEIIKTTNKETKWVRFNDSANEGYRYPKCLQNDFAVRPDGTERTSEAVSYTHLTLPTILLV